MTGSRWWTGAALVPAALLVILRGLRNTDLINDSPLGHWYGQLALVALGLVGYAAVALALRRAHRRPSSHPSTPVDECAAPTGLDCGEPR